MPIYEYECSSCSHVFEIFQRMTEDPVTSCPDCSGTVKKLVSRSSFQLKGGGWYADGYSSKTSNGSGSTSKSKSSESSKSKSKTASSSSKDCSACSKNKSNCSPTASTTGQ